uniref:SH3 domain-containing kinase-binding protein 1 n=1 Tax=Haemonchus contortus TaxID=6289 RepID=A0A7I5E630_HAECO
MASIQGDIMVGGNVKSLVDRLSKDFSASKPPLSAHEPKKPLVSKPSQPLQHVIVAFAYKAEQSDELSLAVGDVIEVLEEVEDGWSRGRLLRTNAIGMFPTNFVKPDVPPSSTLNRDEVVVRRTADPDQPEANRRTPSAIGGVNIFGGKTLHADVKEDTKTKEMARVKFEYKPQHSDELELKKIGELVTIIRKDCGDAGWFEGEIEGRRGLFPDNFVELVQVPISTQSGTIYNPPLSHHSKIVTKHPMVNPPGMMPPAVPAKPLKQKLSESSTSINGAGASPPSSAVGMSSPPPLLPSQLKQQNSAFEAARKLISKDLVVGQPGQVSSKLTKSVIVTSGSEGVAASRPMSSVTTEEASDEVVRPLSHVTKTRARPPGKRPASMMLIKKKGSMDNLLESPSKPVASELPEKSTFTSTIGTTLSSPHSSFSTNREVHTMSPASITPASITPPVKAVPLRPPPVETKLEEKKEHVSNIKPSAGVLTRFSTLPSSSTFDSEWVSRKEYNELLERLASMEARIAQLEKR